MPENDLFLEFGFYPLFPPVLLEDEEFMTVMMMIFEFLVLLCGPYKTIFDDLLQKQS